MTTTNNNASAAAGIERMRGLTSMGASYKACGARTDEFLALAAEYNRISVDEVRSALAAGRRVVYELLDGLAYDLRDADLAAARGLAVATRQSGAPGQLHCTACGQTGNRGSYPFSTNPNSGRCDDCA